jgi:hypothetical protein
MNRLSVCVGCVLFAVGGQVAAQCSTGRVNLGNTLRTFLQNKTVCGTGVVPANAGDHWQEWHQGGGLTPSPLTEYAQGPTDPVDPTHPVGTWSASRGTNSLVTYTYTDGGTYIWALYNDGGGNYSFCTGPGGTVHAKATFFIGQETSPGTACTSFPPP